MVGLDGVRFQETKLEMLNAEQVEPLTLLVISYFFPPDSEVGGNRVAGFCRYFPEFGIRPIVLTIDQASCEAVDPSLSIPDGLQIERVRPEETLLGRYKRLRVAAYDSVPLGGSGDQNSTATSSKGSAVRMLRNQVLAVLQYPDMYRAWYSPAAKAGKRIGAARKLDAVLSSGPPWTSHAVASSVARRLRLPWIADFRDEWTIAPWRKQIREEQGTPGWRESLDRWTEARWLRQAVLSVCTTNQQRDAILAAHPKLKGDRVITITNGFEPQPNGFAIGSATNNQPKILLHAGQLYAGRRIESFCQAVSALIRDGRLSRSDIQVRLLGKVNPDIERGAHSSARELFDDKVIEILPRIPRDQAQSEMRKADVLLIIQGQHPTAIPAKFFEYLLTGKPILALVGPGALHDIVLQTKSGCVANPSDQREIEVAIQKVLQMKTRTPEEVALVAKQFNFRNLTEQLAQQILAVVPR
jgi:glycosyltransferase involved in cell wall biosynthesis